VQMKPAPHGKLNAASLRRELQEVLDVLRN
jgi:hypothetical protein